MSEVSSSAYPDLGKTGRKDANWVSKAGGLPRYIERIAKHLHYEKGKDVGHSIAIAVNVVKKMCGSGDTNFPGKQNVNAKSRGEACKAVAEWEAKKARSHVSEAVLTTATRKGLSKGEFAIPEHRAYPIHDESHARNALSRVSQHGTPDEKARVRAAVKRRYPHIGEALFGLPDEAWVIVEAILEKWEPTEQFLDRLEVMEAAGSWPVLPSWPFIEKLHTEIALVEGHRDWMDGMALDVGAPEPPAVGTEVREVAVGVGDRGFAGGLVGRGAGGGADLTSGAPQAGGAERCSGWARADGRYGRVALRGVGSEGHGHHEDGERASVGEVDRSA